MKLKLNFRLIVTILSIVAAILLGLVRISDPEFVQVLRLKYFDQLQIKYPRTTEGQTYSVIVDIDEKSLREIGQWPWPRTVLADLFNKSKDAEMTVSIKLACISTPGILSSTGVGLISFNPVADVPKMPSFPDNLSFPTFPLIISTALT